ncbi:MAG: response regulator [Opitutaceae bacterium]|nr:response regulator [Opitutaceae bacterium]
MQHEYLVFLTGLGWIVNAMIGWLGAGLPGALNRRAAMMLVLFGAVQSAFEALSRFFVDGSATSAQVLALLAFVKFAALWESARALHAALHGRRWPVTTHLPFLVTLGGMIMGPFLPAGVSATICSAIVLWGGSVVPVLISVTAGWQLWCWIRRSPHRPWFARLTLQIMAVALMLTGWLFGPRPVAPEWDPLRTAVPWLIVIGLAVAGMWATAARSRLTLGFAVLLIMIPLFNPRIAEANIRRTEQTWHQRLGQRAAKLALHPAVLALARGETLSTEASHQLRTRLLAEFATDAGLRVVQVWRLQDGHIYSLARGRPEAPETAENQIRYHRPATADELRQIPLGRAFFAVGTAADQWPLVTAVAPVNAEGASAPSVWVGLEYSLAWWHDRLDAARRATAWISVIFSIFIAGGLVLSWQQAVDAGRTLQIERTEAANRAKTEFLAFLSHEMRTPLQTILGRAELLHTEPVAARHAAAIDAQGRLLLRLVNDLLDLGTIEAGHFSLRPQAFSLATALACVEDNMRPLAAAKHLALHLNVTPGTPDGLHGDEARLRQILGNLLGNAIKYTTAGAVRLDVTASATAPGQAQFTFCVQDTGPGLPPEKISRLFTLFTRLDAGDTFTREGTGVGLALVHRLCELMGGNVAAANRAGGGSTFTVQLPFPLARAPAPAVTPAIAPAAVPVASLAILLAEDNTAAREVLAEGLRQAGHHVTAVADGLAARAAHAQQRFDVVVLDVNLPGIDGIALAREFSAGINPPRLIGCSAEVIPATRAAALAAGMELFLEKPVSLHALVTALAPKATTDVFTVLRSSTPAVDVCALVRKEFPGIGHDLAAALDAGHTAAARRLIHYLHTSALFLGDAALAAQCGLASEAAARSDPSAFAAAGRAVLLSLARLA